MDFLVYYKDYLALENSYQFKLSTRTQATHTFVFALRTLPIYYNQHSPWNRNSMFSAAYDLDTYRSSVLFENTTPTWSRPFSLLPIQLYQIVLIFHSFQIDKLAFHIRFGCLCADLLLATVIQRGFELTVNTLDYGI